MKAQSTVAIQSTYHHRWGVMAGILCLLLLSSGLSLQALTLTAEEQKLASLLTGNSGQRRDRSAMKPDDRLIQVARARAADMAKRRYFDHVNPDGIAANALVRATGYRLPTSWSTSPKANNIESIGAGYGSASEAWSGWMGSSGHKTHLLATESFYRDQTSYGIGHYYDASSPYKHYWVVITAPPSPVETLVLATPTAGARVTAPSLALTGSVSGNAVFSALEYRLDTPTGPGAWTTVPLHGGTTVAKWSASVGGLKPGLNTVRVRALKSGAVARETTRNVRMVVVKPLVVAVEGEGAVTTGFLGTTQREIGVPLTIAAKPKPGAILSHWTGLPGNSNIYQGVQTFAMEEGLAVTAHFVPDPYIALAAGYAGVFTDTSPAHGTTGALFAKLTNGGALTGAVFFSGQRWSISGRFDSQGDVTIVRPRPGKTPLTFVLHIDPTGVDPRITGTVTDGTVTLALDAARGAQTVEPGQFNVRINPAANPVSPQGYGYASLYRAANGQVRVVGKLADGSTIAAASWMAGDAVPVYVPLYGHLGSVAGTITMNGSTAQGALEWHQPARPGARFAAAYDTANTVAGSLYTPVKAPGSALTFTTGKLEIDSPELDAILSLSFGLNPGSRVTFPQVPPKGWKLVLNARTGRFVGAYVHPEYRVLAFSGVLDQAANAGYGYSLSLTQSAAVSLVE